MALNIRRDPQADVINAGALRLTWVSGGLAGIGAVVTAFNEQFGKIFGDDVADGTKAAVLIAIIAAWAVIAVADLLARALAVSRSPRQLAVAPRQFKVSIPALPADQEEDWLVSAVECNPSNPDALRLLVLKPGEGPRWVASDEVVAQE